MYLFLLVFGVAFVVSILWRVCVFFVLFFFVMFGVVCFLCVGLCASSSGVFAAYAGTCSFSFFCQRRVCVIVVCAVFLFMFLNVV